jgi:hypothetical protein
MTEVKAHMTCAAAALAGLGTLLVCAGCPSVALLQGGSGPAMGLATGLGPPGFTRLRAVASVEQIERGKRIRGRVYVFVERPSTIRIDVMSPADTPLSILTASAERFSILDVGGNVFYTGLPSTCNVEKLVSIPMSPEALVDILTGRPPMIEAKARSIEWKPKGYHLLTLTGPAGDLSQTVQLVSGMLGTHAIRSVVWRGESLLYDLRFEQVAPVGGDGFAMPRRIRFAMPSEGTQVTLEYSKVEIDPELPEGIFDFAPPAGIPMLKLDCDDVD